MLWGIPGRGGLFPAVGLGSARPAGADEYADQKVGGFGW